MPLNHKYKPGLDYPEITKDNYCHNHLPKHRINFSTLTPVSADKMLSHVKTCISFLRPLVKNKNASPSDQAHLVADIRLKNELESKVDWVQKPSCSIS